MALTTDDLLNEIGGFGRFQVFFTMAIFSHKLNLGWSILQMSYAGFIPNWHCDQNPELEVATSSYSNATLNKCSMNISTSLGGMEEERCFDFRYEGPRRTIITEWDLVCDKKWIKATVTSIQMFGVLLGAVCSGQLSELFGRKKTLFSFSLVHALLNIGAAFSPNWEVFAAFRFFIGAGVGGEMVCIFPYPMEFMPIKSRHVLPAFPLWSISVALFAVAAYLIEDWSYLHIACGLCGVLPLSLYFWVPESARWLIIQGRTQEAVEVFRKVARVNGKEILPNTPEIIQKIYQEELALRTNGKKYYYWDLFKGWRMLTLTLLLAYQWLMASMVYYGISFGVSSLAGNLYLNIFLLALVEVPGLLALVYFNKILGRKPNAIAWYLLALLAMSGCLVLQFAMSSNSRGNYITVLSLVAKLGINTSWAVIQVQGSELYPTVVRNLANGLFNTAARIGGIIAPLVLDLDENQVTSYIIMASSLLVAMVLILFVPETKGKTMKDSIDFDMTTAKVEPMDGKERRANSGQIMNRNGKI